eukprot:2754431-Prymnesium_polylepis.1
MLTRVVGAGRGLIGSTETNQVRHDDPAAAGQEHWDHLAIQKAPRWLAVQQQHDRPIAFVDVREAQVTLHCDVPWLVRIQLASRVETLFRRPRDRGRSQHGK